MAINNFVFYDTNYLYDASVASGTSYSTATVGYVYDSRSDAGNLLYTTETASLVFDLGQTLTMSDFAIFNHNITGVLQVSTGTSWQTVLTCTAGADTTRIYTITGRYIRMTTNSTTTGEPAYIGELLCTQQKFKLKCNPNMYVPNILPIGNRVDLYNGRSLWQEIGDQFTAQLGYDYLVGDFDSMTGTDLQNLTELCRQKVSFIFHAYGSGTSNNPDLYSYRKKDIFKCKIFDSTSYEMASTSFDDIIRARYNLVEVK